MQAPFLYLMRHGATEWNLQDRLNSRTETDVLPEEEMEIESMGRRLAAHRFARLLSSPSRRALQTARILAGALSIEIEQEELLREVDFGAFEGRTQSELAAGEMAPSYAAWRRGEENVMKAESLGDSATRAAELMRIMEDSPSPVLAVSHGVFIRVLLASQVLGMRPTDYRRVRLDNARLCAVARQDGMLRLTALNARDPGPRGGTVPVEAD